MKITVEGSRGSDGVYTHVLTAQLAVSNGPAEGTIHGFVSAHASPERVRQSASALIAQLFANVLTNSNSSGLFDDGIRIFAAALQHNREEGNV